MSGVITQVAVGVIKNNRNEILISKRADHVHQGGVWEFPGGKIEPEETARHALARELKEELGIDCLSIKPLIDIEYDYGDKKVCLITFIVDRFSGQPAGREGQKIQWVAESELSDYSFPAANLVIMHKLQLPEWIQITGQYHTVDDLIMKSEHCIRNGVNMINFRAHHLDDALYEQHARQLKQLCNDHGVRLIINRNLALFEKIDADGLHVNSVEVKKYSSRPVDDEKYFSVSCHHIAELSNAQILGADYCLLSPVRRAISHDAGDPLGLQVFEQYCKQVNISVYALGGMYKEDIGRVQELGGAGIATVSEFWV